MTIIKKAFSQYPYRQVRLQEATLGRQMIRFARRPSISQWNRVTPAEALLAETARPPSVQQAIHFGFGSGALSVILASQMPQDRLWMVEASCLAYDLAARTLKENNQSARFHLQIELPEEQYGKFDYAVIELPKGRKLAQRWLVQAHLALHQDGVLHLAGANKAGIQSVLKDAQALFGPGTILGYKKGNRAVEFIKNQNTTQKPEWSMASGIAKNTWHELDVPVGEGEIHLYTLPGVFAYDTLDAGSEFLLEHMHFPASGRALDLGCGNGLLGIVASRFMEWVDLVDANLLAVAATQHNLTELKVQNAQVFLGDVTEPVMDHNYQLVVTNPPFHTSHGVDYAVALAFIAESYQVLAPGGELWLVANRFIRYNPILANHFKQVDLVAANNHYQVYRALK